jgi:hypothetical protein
MTCNRTRLGRWRLPSPPKQSAAGPGSHGSAQSSAASMARLRRFDREIWWRRRHRRDATDLPHQRADVRAFIGLEPGGRLA